MRFTSQAPQEDDERVVSRFLWIPRSEERLGPNGWYRETRWLEMANVKQVYMTGEGWIDFGFNDDTIATK